jgi:hypothetical protein
MTGVNSGQRATSASINAFFAQILSSPFTQRTFQGGGGSGLSNTSFATPTTACTTTITSTGGFALVVIGALLTPSAAGNTVRGSLAVSGATTITAGANLTAQFFIQNTSVPPAMSTSVGLIAITPGTNTYTLQYLTTAGTYTAGSQSLTVIAP